MLLAGEDSAGVRGYDLRVDLGPFRDTVAEVFDPRTGRFRVTGEYLPNGEEARPAGAALVALGDGGALLVGGYANSDTPLDRSLRYDPGTNTWTETGRLRTARAHSVAALLADGKVLVAGGEDAYGATASAEIFDPATGTWSSAPAMPESRIGGAAVALPDGSVLIAGGYGRHSHRWGDNPLCPPAVAAAVRFVPAP